MKLLAALLIAFLFIGLTGIVAITFLMHRRVHKFHRSFAVQAVGDDQLSLLDIFVIAKVESALTARAVRDLKDEFIQRLWKIRSWLSVAFGAGLAVVIVGALIRGADRDKATNGVAHEAPAVQQLEFDGQTLWIYLAAFAVFLLSLLFVLVSSVLIHKRLFTHHASFLATTTGSAAPLSQFSTERKRKVDLLLPAYARAEPIDRRLLGLVTARKLANRLGLLSFAIVLIAVVIAVPK